MAEVITERGTLGLASTALIAYGMTNLQTNIWISLACISLATVIYFVREYYKENGRWLKK